LNDRRVECRAIGRPAQRPWFTLSFISHEDRVTRRTCTFNDPPAAYGGFCFRSKNTNQPRGCERDARSRTRVCLDKTRQMELSASGGCIFAQTSVLEFASRQTSILIPSLQSTW
jgi:hypothetical protein